jgi:actin-related protein
VEANSLDHPTKDSIYPIERGVIQDWTRLEELWQHILYRELKVPFGDEDLVMMTENSALMSRQDREKIVQILFESCHVPGMFMADQAVSALYACGTINGLVLDVGYGKTDITPVIDGNVVRYAAQSIPLGGQDVDDFLMTLLKNDTAFMSSFPSLRMIDVVKIKEQLAEIVMEEATISSSKSMKAKLSEDQVIPIGNPRYTCAKILFDPIVYGKQMLGVVETCHNVVSRCDVDKRRMLFDTLLLTGRTSLIKGFQSKFLHEINKYLLVSDLVNEGNLFDAKLIRLPVYMRNVYEHPELASWIGASLISKVSGCVMFIDSELSHKF